ncbi:phosphotriesterase family protein [Thermoanaerobacterium sp. DL9XJH110]|uniref:phosphotriesterase family protein n=1 Tax=Thermoanaerobacterium sp. DL9XJH110 TaxID=3386643 RepID=UPI003BB5A82B
MVRKIRTVTGDIDGSDIKKVMVHEHLAFDLSRVRGDNTSILGDEETLPAICEEMQQLKEYGFNTIVELTNMGMGRNPLTLQRMAQTTGFFIVAGTGFYKEDFYPKEVFAMKDTELIDKLTAEILEGIDNTGVKAGVYGEIGTSFGRITPAEEKVFRAVARSHKITGAPISTHCELGTMGLEQRKIFEEEGVSPDRVSFGHQDLNEDMSVQLELLRWGAYIQFDTIGKAGYRSDEARIHNLLHLLDKGYENQIMLSCDITRKSYLKKFGGYGYTHLHTNFLSELKKRGVPGGVIEKMTIENPRRFLAFIL